MRQSTEKGKFLDIANIQSSLISDGCNDIFTTTLDTEFAPKATVFAVQFNKIVPTQIKNDLVKKLKKFPVLIMYFKER